MRRAICSPTAQHPICAGCNTRRSSGICAAAFLSSVILFTSGCTAIRAGKHPATFATAANLVVQNSTDAYKASNDLHEREEVSAGALAVEEGKEWDCPLFRIDPVAAAATVADRIGRLDRSS